MLLIIDNYDSFTYNLVQLAGTFSQDIRVVRNDALTVDEIRALAPTHIILSPGPGYPKDAGVCEELVQKLAGELPILGVCLGHQGICEAFGATIAHAHRLMHGKKSDIKVDTASPLFTGLPATIEAARYHSLIAQSGTLPAKLAIIAQDALGEIMAVQHKQYNIFGVQFHPESVLTPQGDVMMNNFLALRGGTAEQ
ncbi:MAG: aminodeoxychorismate/anthranilate synthase component II [Acetanaerobacterium sp.]